MDIINGKRSSNAEHERLEEKESELMNEQKNLQEELTNATKMLEEGSARLATAANDKLHILKTKLIKNSENLNR
jgi:hypothetical protein